MPAIELQALRPLALGHDQEASACPWAQLTRRTAEYPSRRAQLASAVAEGGLPATADVVERLYRCDDCGMCRTWSGLAQPPDLARALWPVRALLVQGGAVPEVDGLRANVRQHGHLYGDLSQAMEALGPGDPNADVLFVPDGAVLAYQPAAASAALRAARCVAGKVAVQRDLPDSGQALRELGLAGEAEQAQAAVRQRISQAGYRQVLAGTPKEALALSDLLDGLAVDVQYVGSALARAALGGRVPLPAGAGGGRRIVLHPSAALLHGLPDYALLEDWLSGWLGDGYRIEPDARRTAWPAAVERPTVGLEPALARRLAERRMERLLAAEPSVILTCDPYSCGALRAVAPAGVDVLDLLTFAAPTP